MSRAVEVEYLKRRGGAQVGDRLTVPLGRARNMIARGDVQAVTAPEAPQEASETETPPEDAEAPQEAAEEPPQRSAVRKRVRKG